MRLYVRLGQAFQTKYFKRLINSFKIRLLLVNLSNTKHQRQIPLMYGSIPVLFGKSKVQTFK